MQGYYDDNEQLQDLIGFLNINGRFEACLKEEILKNKNKLNLTPWKDFESDTREDSTSLQNTPNKDNINHVSGDGSDNNNNNNNNNNTLQLKHGDGSSNSDCVGMLSLQTSKNNSISNSAMLSRAASRTPTPVIGSLWLQEPTWEFLLERELKDSDFYHKVLKVELHCPMRNVTRKKICYHEQFQQLFKKKFDFVAFYFYVFENNLFIYGFVLIVSCI